MSTNNLSSDYEPNETELDELRLTKIMATLTDLGHSFQEITDSFHAMKNSTSNNSDFNYNQCKDELNRLIGERIMCEGELLHYIITAHSKLKALYGPAHEKGDIGHG